MAISLSIQLISNTSSNTKLKPCVYVMNLLRNQLFAINVPLITCMRHNSGIILSKKMMETDNHLERNDVQFS